MHLTETCYAKLLGSAQRYRRWFLPAALAATAVSLGITVIVVARRDSALDFYVYYLAAYLAAHGHSPYHVGQPAWDALARHLGVTHYTSPYRYPPYTAALVSLLLPLGPRLAMIVWEVVSSLALVSGVALAGRALGYRHGVAVALCALVVFVPVYNVLGDGQVDALAFFFLCLALWGLATDRDLPLGVGIAAAAALKLTPLLLLAYLMWRRRWRAALIAGATLAALTVLTLPVVGAHSYLEYADKAVTLTAPTKIALSPQNQTTLGAASRLVLRPATWSWRSWSDVGAVRFVRGLSIAFTLALAAATGLVLWPRRRARRRHPHAVAAGARERLRPYRDSTTEDQLGFGMVIAASLVAGPFTFYHQFAWLLPVLLLLTSRPVSRGRWPLVGAVFAMIVAIDVNELLWIGSTWSGIRQVWEGPYHLVVASGLWRTLSLPFLVAVIAWALSLALVTGGRDRDEASAENLAP